MKLLQRTNRAYLLISTILLLVAGLLLFVLMRQFIGEEADEALQSDKVRISRHLEAGDLPFLSSIPPVLEVETLSSLQAESMRFSDTLMMDPVEQEEEPFRQLVAIETHHGVSYRIIIRQKKLENHDFLNSIGIALGIVLLLLLIGLQLLNRIVSRKIWNPFYENLNKLKAFSLREDQPLALADSDITEFQELKAAIGKLTDKVRSDYQNLKAFSENASHEMQTPLTIIRMKLDEALQDPDLSEEQAQQIQSAYSAADRLSRLNQSLLLLTRIENRQFEETDTFHPSASIRHQLEIMEDFMGVKGIELSVALSDTLLLRANPMLWEVLLSNLLGNAIRHCEEGGQIEIHLSEESLRMSNPGKPLSRSPESLFERFQKGDPASASPGLGLAIVKQICETYGWKITYEVLGSLHTIEIRF
jgi:signal transduction histidine kinase